MQNSFFRNKRITVVGLGLLGGGLGTVEYLVRHGAKVTITDLKNSSDLKPSIDKLSGFSVHWVLGRHEEKDFTDTDIIIKNPAVPSNSPFLTIARKNNITIEMAESLFMKLSPTKKIIGVTGTRGKSTTCSLIYAIFKQAGYDVYLAGNTRGVATLGLLDKVSSKSVVILELSSWQLESFGWFKISPPVAAITNIYPDHLNRYDSMDDYIADKKNIYLFQKKDDYVVLNSENPTVAGFAADAKSKVTYFSAKDWPKNTPLTIIGRHNIENAAAALTVARILNLDQKKAISTIASFPGLSMRLEEVGRLNNIRFINDSTSTTPIASIKAIQSFPSQRVILIAGGNTKQIPLKELVDEINQKVKQVILFEGTAFADFKKVNHFEKVAFDDFRGAILRAYKHAKAGDVILFSPGVTHLPVINEFERGERFSHEVQTFCAQLGKK